MWENHPDLRNPSIRFILVEWMLEFKDVLGRDIVYLAIIYIDKYMEKTKNVTKEELQLKAAACLLLADKMIGGHIHSACFYAGVCLSKKKDLLDAEWDIVMTFDFQLMMKTPLDIIYQKKIEKKEEEKINGILDCAYLDFRITKYNSEYIASTLLEIIRGGRNFALREYRNFFQEYLRTYENSLSIDIEHRLKWIGDVVNKKMNK